MLRATFLFLSLLFFSPPSPGQTVEPQSRTMEAVLSEIRQLRQDLQAAAVATRKAQIVIYRLHVQGTVVERARERLENAKGALAQLEIQRKELNEQIQQFEETRDHAETERQRRQCEDFITRFKASLEALVPEEQELRAKQIESEADLHTEQSKWDRLQEDLDRLENSLENSALQASDRR